MKKPSIVLVLSLLAFVATELYIGSCKNSNPVGTGGGGTLTVRPESLSIGILQIATCTISGGKKPYALRSVSDTSKVMANVTDSTLYVIGRALGHATVVVHDSGGSSTGTAYVWVDTGATPPTSQLSFYPSSLELTVGDNGTAYVYGGVMPYAITGTPTPGVASASISGSTVSVHAVGAGTTPLVVSDASFPPRSGVLMISVTAGGCALDVSGTWEGTYTFTTGSMNGQTFDAEASFTGSGSSTQGTFRDVSHSITWTLSQFSCSGTTIDASFTNGSIGTLTVHGTVSGSTISGTFSDMYGTGNFSLTRSGGGTTGGTVSFNSTKGNFSSTGNFDTTHFVSNVGAFSFYDSQYQTYYLVITAIEVKSSTTYQSTGLLFASSSPIVTGSYTGYPKYSTLTFLPLMSVYDTSYTTYVVMHLEGAISGLSSTSAQGTFSGKGANTVNVSDSITVSAGTFNVTYINWYPWTVAPSGLVRDAMKRTVDALMRTRERPQ